MALPARAGSLSVVPARMIEASASTNALPMSSEAAALLGRFRSRQGRAGIIGLGYVGLPLSMLFVESGFEVTGFDIDETKVKALQDGRSYIYRIPSVENATARRRGFAATADFAQIAEQEAVILCVPTPLNAQHEPDLSYIESTAQSIAPFLRAGQLIVLESTTYPGTTEELLIPLLEAGNRSGLKVQSRMNVGTANVFYAAFSPEREDPGNTSIPRREIPKVVGGHEATSAALAVALYEGVFCRAVQVSSTRAAEMVKLLENIYRCVNIALVNELKMLAMRMGIDIWEVIEAASTKPFGFQPFYPGPGLGGHCIPIDPFYLSWKAKEYDFRTRFIELAGEINESMPQFVVQQLMRALNTQRKPLNGSRVLVLGMSYKRESPSLTLIELLRAEGAEVAYNDPYHPSVGRGRHYNLHMTSTPLGLLEEFDCTLIATDHTAYDYADIVRRSHLVVDTRNATRGIDAKHIFRC